MRAWLSFFLEMGRAPNSRSFWIPFPATSGVRSPCGPWIRGMVPSLLLAIWKIKRRIPLANRRLGQHECPRPEITLWVRSRYQEYTKIHFIVDTAADFTAIPIPLAQDEGLDFTRSEALRSSVGGLVGRVEKYLGSLHVRIAGEEFDWPCDFLMQTALPSSQVSGTSPRSPRRYYAVLGRAGFLAAFAIAIGGKYLTIKRWHPGRSWWRQFWSLAWLERTRYHAIDDPL